MTSPSGRLLPARERARREGDKLRRTLPRPPILSLDELAPGHHFRAEISGPDGTPFESARFNVDVTIVDEYPFKPPGVRFITPERIFHPNICPRTGGICLDILNDANLWTPAMNLESLLLSVASLLSEPRTEHGLNNEALELLQRDPEAYAKRAASTAGIAPRPLPVCTTKFGEHQHAAPCGIGHVIGGEPIGETGGKEYGTHRKGDRETAVVLPKIDEVKNKLARDATAAATDTRRIAMKTQAAQPTDLSGLCCLAFLVLVVAVGMAQRSVNV